MIIRYREAGYRWGFGVDDRFAGLGLHLDDRRMLEGSQEIIVKLALQTTITRAACIQDDEISVTDILGLSSVIE